MLVGLRTALKVSCAFVRSWSRTKSRNSISLHLVYEKFSDFVSDCEHNPGPLVSSRQTLHSFLPKVNFASMRMQFDSENRILKWLKKSTGISRGATLFSDSERELKLCEKSNYWFIEFKKENCRGRGWSQSGSLKNFHELASVPSSAELSHKWLCSNSREKVKSLELDDFLFLRCNVQLHVHQLLDFSESPTRTDGPQTIGNLKRAQSSKFLNNSWWT